MSRITYRSKDFSWDEGYVFYQSLSEPGRRAIWHKVYQSAMSSFKGARVNLGHIPSSKEVSAQLKTLGHLEQNKERAILEQILGCPLGKANTVQDYSDIIKGINILYRHQPEFKALLTQIEQGRTKNRNKERGFSAFSFFDSYFVTAFGEEIIAHKNDPILYNAIINQDEEAWTQRLLSDDIAGRAIDKAIAKISESTDVINQEEYHLWTTVARLLEEVNAELNANFKAIVRSRLPLEAAAREAFTVAKQLDDGKITVKGTTGKLRSVISAKNRELENRRLAGFLDELFTGMDVVLDFNGQTTSYSATSIHPKSTMMKTDNITVFSTDVGADAEKIAKLMRNVSPISLEGAARQFETIVDRMANLKDSFFVMESAKVYSMSNFRGFAGGGARPVSQLPEYLSRMGAHVDAFDFVQTILNSAPGTIGEGERETIRDEVSHLISAHIAQFLFDDWTGIGNSISNVIHVFSLDNVYIPLSFLLIGLGNAFETTSREEYAKISFSYPKLLHTPKIKDTEVLTAWDEERRHAYEKTTFTVRFLANFKTIVSDTLKSLA